MIEPRRELRWVPAASVAAILALVALTQSPHVIELARGVVRSVPSYGDLPGAAGWSLLRMTAAYLASLVFAWFAGWWAASSPRAARILLPLLDVGQSVPVLGFFPAAIYIFLHLMGGGRVALELASIFLIFTSQTWNLAFGVYEGLSTIPQEIRTAADSLGVRGVLRWRTLMIPACIPTLLYNSILSWANGWYFLIACEIIVAGPAEYDLPGLGSTLSRAIARGDLRLAAATLTVLVGIVVVFEFALWRPLRAWSSRFRYDTHGTDEEATASALRLPDLGLPAALRVLRAAMRGLSKALPIGPVNRAFAAAARTGLMAWRWLRWPAAALAGVFGVFALGAVARALTPPWPPEARLLPLALLLSFLRIAVAYALALLWIIPVTLWVSDHPRAGRALSLIAQVGGSIPATGFFPVLVALFVGRFGGMEVISIALALTGMQWYLLFNMLAGVQRVPQDLKESLRALGLSRREIHRQLVLPACLPALVTGSVVAWGGTWNALILSEYVVYRGKVYEVLGLGAMLNRATFQTGSRALLILSLTLLVATVVTFNRVVWNRVYKFVHARYRLEV